MSKACLSLVNRLLSYEHNKNADTYNKIFGRCEIALIRSMKLDLHMKERNSYVNNPHVMNLLNAYLKANPRVNDIRFLLSDP
jgi:hypothetical protein